MSSAVIGSKGLERTEAPLEPAAPTGGARGQLRIAIAGAGKMGQHHARAVARLTGLARVVAVADPSAVSREAFQRVCPDAVGFDSLEELLASVPVDVVHVATSPQTHEQVAAQALTAGCHVYVEKPFVETAEAARRLLALADTRQLRICAGHQLLFERPALEALALLPALGTIVHVESYFAFRTVRRSPDGRVPLRPDLQLLDILPHPVYLLLRALERSAPDAATELRSLELGAAGTVHALVRRGSITGSLVVTLEGRPVESYLRIVGTNGVLHADFVRGTVQKLFGPGTSGIDKVLNPFRLSWQLAADTTAALTRRLVRRQRSYPGLAEIFQAFYTSIVFQGEPAVTPGNLIETTAICERVAEALRRDATALAAEDVDHRAPGAPRVLVTGGTGLLGRQLASQLAAQHAAVRVLARRAPAPWDRVPGVEYVTADLGQDVPAVVMQEIDVVIHCAAETAGGWMEHERNSLHATERVIRAAAAAGVGRVIHVSSLAVLSAGHRGAVNEETPLEAQSRRRGPYVWGKLESERRAVALGSELGVDVRIARPGALVDYQRFEPPGRLGKRIGNVFVAVGSPRDTLGVVDVPLAARVLAWEATNFEDAPPVLNVLAPALPTRRELLSHLRSANPGLRTIWLPMFVLHPLSWLAIALQKVMRPRKPAMNVAKVFASQRYDTALVQRIVSRL
jgi:predicted dehydrogenase/nucleoside-diphosphate-sugar epimerase